MDISKESFLRNEFLTMSVLGALGRSNTYSELANKDDKNNFRNALREKLEELSSLYKSTVTEKEHLSNIEKLSDDLTSRFPQCLRNVKFRIGIAQKALNLYLKYLWCVNLIPRPLHCPFDSIVISHLPDCSNLNWTSIDTLEDYLRLVQNARIKADVKSIAEWELEIWLNNVQSKRSLKKCSLREEDKAPWTDRTQTPESDKVSTLTSEKEAIGMEDSEKKKTREYIKRLKKTHKDRKEPVGIEGLTDKQKNLYDTIKEIVNRNPNQRLTNKQITEKYEIRHGTLNLLPTDFCYNLINMADIETKFLIRIKRGKFEFVDFNWLAKDRQEKITWTPIGKNVPEELKGNIFEIGIYYKGEYRWNFSELDEYL